MQHESTANYDAINTDDLGNVNISTSVLETIAINAASETEGVVTRDAHHHSEKGINNLFSRPRVACNVTVDDRGGIIVDVRIHVAYSYSVPDVAIRVQEAIKEQILYMTDLVIQSVNVHVLSIETDPAQYHAMGDHS